MFFLNSDIMVFLFSVEAVLLRTLTLPYGVHLSPLVRCQLPRFTLAELIPLLSLVMKLTYQERVVGTTLRMQFLKKESRQLYLHV
jgi:hypothetical protein